MKIKLTALICVAVMLVMMLAGCGAAEQENVAETAAVTEAVEETTVETTVETEPEEPETAFEALGLTMWEDAPFAYPNEFDHGDGIRIPGVRVEYSDLLVEYYSAPNSDLNSERKVIITKELIPSDLVVMIQEFSSENFDSPDVQDAVEAFYNRDNLMEGKISKDAWLTKRQGYKIVSCTIQQYIYTSDSIDNSLAMGANSFFVVYHPPAVFDRENGFLMEGNADLLNEVGSFSIAGESGEIDISCLYTFRGEWMRNSATNTLGDCYLENIVYALVPEDYENIAFTFAEPMELGEDEVYMNNDEPDVEPWQQYMLQEYIEEYDRYHMYYFNMVKE